MSSSTTAGRPLLPRVLPALSFLLLVLVIYADPLFTRRNFAGRDLVAYNLPMEKGIHDAYARGHLPIWTPYISGGRPLLPNPNAGAMYPVRPVLSGVSFPLAMRIYPILHWAAAGIGMICFVRAIGGSSWAAWLAAATYVFSGVVVSEVFFPHIQAGMALFPWILYTLRRPFSGEGWRTAVLGVLFGLDMLAGDVFTVALAVLCAALWIALEEPPADGLRRLARLGLALVLAILFALPQIVATSLWIPQTNRGTLGMKLDEVLLYSVSPWRLIEFVVPYPFGPAWTIDDTGMWGWPIYKGKLTGLFITLYAGALATIAFFTTWKTRSAGRRFAHVLLAIALLLCVPPSLVPSGWTSISSPLPLRNPEKITIILTLALALLSGIAVDQFRQGRRLPRWTITVAVVLAVAAVLAWAFSAPVGRALVALVRSPPNAAPRASVHTPGALAEAGLLWAMTLVGLDLLRRSRGAAPAVGLALLTAIPIAANRRIARSFSEEDIFAPPPFVRFLWKHDPDGRYRTLGESMYRAPSELLEKRASSDPAYLDFTRKSWYEHSQALWQRGTVFNGDFDVGDLARTEILRRVSATAVRFRDSQEFFRSLSLRWGTRNRDDIPITGYRRVGGEALYHWDELPGALPDVRLAGAWREETASLPALGVLPALSPGEIVVETGARRKEIARPGSLRILVSRPEELRVETNAPDPTWLFALRGYWPYRTVRVDGRPAEVFPAQLAFSALPLSAGRHRIEWREEIPGWTGARWGPLLGLAAAALLIVRGRVRQLSSG